MRPLKFLLGTLLQIVASILGYPLILLVFALGPKSRGMARAVVRMMLYGQRLSGIDITRAGDKMIEKGRRMQGL